MLNRWLIQPRYTASLISVDEKMIDVNCRRGTMPKPERGTMSRVTSRVSRRGRPRSIRLPLPAAPDTTLRRSFTDVGLPAVARDRTVPGMSGLIA